LQVYRFAHALVLFSDAGIDKVLRSLEH